MAKEAGMENLYISDMDEYLFGEGTHYEIYKKLGAHLTERDGEKGCFFAVWAPAATAVYVIGDFNGWDEYAHGMTRHGGVGIYSIFIPGVVEGARYKFLIHTHDGRKLYKADPFGNQAQMRPETASVVADLSGFEWEDETFLKNRDTGDVQKKPMAIYECHIGSFMKHPNGTHEGYRFSPKQ